MFFMQGKWIKILISIGILGLVLIAYVDNVIEINRLYKENLKLKSQLQNIKERRIKILKKINDLESPERIIELAQKNLGMKFPVKPAKKL